MVGEPPFEKANRHVERRTPLRECKKNALYVGCWRKVDYMRKTRNTVKNKARRVPAAKINTPLPPPVQGTDSERKIGEREKIMKNLKISNPNSNYATIDFLNRCTDLIRPALSHFEER